MRLNLDSRRGEKNSLDSRGTQGLIDLSLPRARGQLFFFSSFGCSKVRLSEIVAREKIFLSLFICLINYVVTWAETREERRRMSKTNIYEVAVANYRAIKSSARPLSARRNESAKPPDEKESNELRKFTSDTGQLWGVIFLHSVASAVGFKRL